MPDLLKLVNVRKVTRGINARHVVKITRVLDKTNELRVPDLRKIFSS